MISISVVNWLMREEGWTFADGPSVIQDPIHCARFIREVYTADDERYTGSVTVPVLWDKKTGKIKSMLITAHLPNRSVRVSFKHGSNLSEKLCH